MNYSAEPYLAGLLRTALKEDIGKSDVTTESLILKKMRVKAVLRAKQDCIICGVAIAGLVFKAVDKNIKFNPCVNDGQKIKRNKIIATLSGNARGILSAERVALNFLSLLCGIATETRQYVDKVRPYKVKIVDTRKTIPGLRILEKYAVRIGGGFNHRFSLDEMIIIKDNHLKITGGYAKLTKIKHRLLIEAEVNNLKEFKQALKIKPDIIMLDNMGSADIKKAVGMRNHLCANLANPLPKLEASGGITLKNVKQAAACGVDMISIGALTHSLTSVDMALDIL